MEELQQEIANKADIADLYTKEEADTKYVSKEELGGKIIDSTKITLKDGDIPNLSDETTQLLTDDSILTGAGTLSIVNEYGDVLSYLINNRCDEKYALKNDFDQMKTKTDETSNSLNTLSQGHLDLSITVGEHATSIISMNNKID